MSTKPFHIYIGYDTREDIAYQVARHSLLKRSSVPIEVIPLKMKELREKGIFTREWDKLQSTEFTYTRFLVPYLNNYQDWAMFVDCDFLFTTDIAKLIALIPKPGSDEEKNTALMCVHHNYVPDEAVKMDGKVQTQYPRKNWSSMILFNCGHPLNRTLTPEVVSKETGAFLHRFQWITDDSLIKPIDYTWNFLEGWYKKYEDGSLPAAIHYTRGGPWFEEYKNCDYAPEWEREKADLSSSSS